MSAFPTTRLRRLRRTPSLRGLVRETRLHLDDFVMPLFVAPEPLTNEGLPAYTVSAYMDAELPAPTAVRRRASGRIVRPDQAGSHRDRLDEPGARVGAAPEQQVRLLSESGETIASTSESNAEHMTAALEPHYGPLTVVPG